MRYTRTDDIAASPAEVWPLLVDVERWPEWTESMRQLTRLDDGPLRVGSTTRVQQPKGRPLVWTVTELAEDTSFTWTATIPGIRFTADHELTPTEGGGVRVVLTFTMGGPMAWLGGLLGGARIRRYVDLEGGGLKRRAEQHPTG